MQTPPVTLATMPEVPPKRLLTEKQARKLGEAIRQNLTDAAEQAQEFHDGEGWGPLGYADWKECCERYFGCSQAWGNQLRRAAQVRRELADFYTDIDGDLPSVGVAAALLPLQTPEARRDAWEALRGRGQKPTTRDAQALVKDVRANLKAAKTPRVARDEPVDMEQDPKGVYRVKTRMVYDSGAMREQIKRSEQAARDHKKAKNLLLPFEGVQTHAHQLRALTPQVLAWAWANSLVERPQPLSSELRRLAEQFSRLADDVEPLEVRPWTVVEGAAS